MIVEALRRAFPGTVAIVETLPPASVPMARAPEWRGVIVVTETRRERMRMEVDGTPVSAWVYGLSTVADVLSARRAQDGAFIRTLASGTTAWSGPAAPDLVAQAGAAFEQGPFPLSRRAATAVWERIRRSLEEAGRSASDPDAQVVIMGSLDTALDGAFALAARWTPGAGHRINALGTVDSRLALAARQAAETSSSAHARYLALARFVEELRRIFPPPPPFLRLRDWGEREGGSLQALLAPYRLVRDGVAAIVAWAPRTVSHLWPVFRLMRLMRAHWRIPVALLLFDMATALISLPVPFLSAALIRSSTTASILATAAAIVGLTLLSSLVGAASGVYGASARETLWVLWQERFVRRLLRAPTEAVRQYAPGELSFRFDDARASFEHLIEIFVTGIRALAYIIPTPFVLLLLPPVFALHVVVVVGLLGVVYGVFSASIFRFVEGVTRLRGQLSARMVEVLTKIPAIQASRLDGAASRRVVEKAKGLRDETIKIQAIISVIGVLLGAVATIAPVLLLVEGILAVRAGTIEYGVALGVGIWIMMIINPVRALFGLGPTVQRLVVRARRFLEVYDGVKRPSTAATTAAGGGHRPFPVHAKELHLADLTYAPTPTSGPLWSLAEKIILPGLTAIVGPSGAGKSTLLLLLNRTLKPAGGRIRIDRVPIDEIDAAEWRRYVAIVPQDDYVLDGTVRENLAVGLPVPPDAFTAEEALRRVGLWAVLEKREGLDTLLTVEGAGGGLSTGERKRLCLARAMLRRPRILLVDEMVDHVEPELEERILGVLRELAVTEDLRVVFIAHRPSAVAAADRAIRLEGRAQ